jgi:ribose transport system substrate-binding protein
MVHLIRRVGALLLTVGLLVPLLAACGGSPTTPSTESTGTTSAATTAVEATSAATTGTAATNAATSVATTAVEATSAATTSTEATSAPATSAAATTAPAAGATSAPAAGTANGPFKIGISNGFVASEWRTQMIQDLQTINAEYKQAGLTTDLEIESADTDVQGQSQQIRNLINKGVNAIIINPNSQTGLNSVIKEAKDAGIIVIAIDQEISAPEAINVVIDQTEWARISAKWLVDQLKGQGNVVIINGVAGHPANEARYNGVKEVFGANPGIKVLNVANANWDQATGQQTMSNLLASQPNIDGVWTQDGMALGVLQAIVAANPSKWPVVVGEARAGYMQLWKKTQDTKPNFTSIGVVNPPGIASSGLRVAIELLQGKKLKDGLLKGQFKNSLYVPIPGQVDQSNFQAEYDKIKDKPASYVLDGIIDQKTADSFFQ